MKITSTSEALSFLYSLSLNASSFRFRGQAHFLWPLQPSIYRFEGFSRYQAVEYESNILQGKPPRPSPPLTHTDFHLEWLMICQHYGVPTRLMDWTTDILIALFFACSDIKEINADGALFICDQNDYKMFAAYNEHAMDTQELAFVSTNVVNPRMRTQAGCFMLWGHAPLDENSTESYDLWQYHEKQEKPHYLDKICIPQHAKKRILKELEEVYSINNDSLYLKNGYLETRFNSGFVKLKETALLITLHKTDSRRLSKPENQKAISLCGIDCTDMIKDCNNLKTIK